MVSFFTAKTSTSWLGGHFFRTWVRRVGWEVIFSELGFAGSGVRKPWREFEGSALELFFHVFLRLSRALIV